MFASIQAASDKKFLDIMTLHSHLKKDSDLRFLQIDKRFLELTAASEKRFEEAQIVSEKRFTEIMSRNNSLAIVDKEALNAIVHTLAADLKTAVDITNEHVRNLTGNTMRLEQSLGKTIKVVSNIQ